MDERVAREIDALVERAETDRETFEPPDTPPAVERSLEYLREGAGPA